MDTVHKAAQDGFKSSTLYQNGRPKYPNEAIQYIMSWLVNENSAQAGNNKRIFLDLGAGTGKLTSAIYPLLQPHNIDLRAVEPVDEMRASFRDLNPQIPIEGGSATNIPYEDNAIDTVIIGQAFHWFATTEALNEIARVLPEGGKLVLVWNTRDPTANSLMRELEVRISSLYPADVPRQQSGQWRNVIDSYPIFSQNHADYFVENVYCAPVNMALDYIMSISVISKLDNERKVALRNDFKQLFYASGEVTTNTTTKVDEIRIFHKLEAYSYVKSSKNENIK